MSKGDYCFAKGGHLLNDPHQVRFRFRVHLVDLSFFPDRFRTVGLQTKTNAASLNMNMFVQQRRELVPSPSFCGVGGIVLPTNCAYSLGSNVQEPLSFLRADKQTLRIILTNEMRTFFQEIFVYRTMMASKRERSVSRLCESTRG
jgi:hypothetical protein